MVEELKSKQKLYIYNGIDSQLEEIEDLADAKEYINDYMEGGDIHPDIESIIILQQVGGVYIEETGEFSELNGDTVPVCKVDVLINENESISFLEWTNDLNKCNYYPVYDTDTSKLDYWENRKNYHRINSKQLYDIFNKKN